MRARYPDVEGFIERDGVKVGYEVFGEGELAVVFPPIDGIVHSRCWKAQVPYLARSFKVVTIDPRGNGRSDRPQTAEAYADTEWVADTVAVMDATGIDRAVLVGLCTSSWRALLAAGQHPDRVLGVVAMNPWAPFLTPPHPYRAAYDFDDMLDTDEGWAKCNRHYWLRDWRGYAEFFFGELLSEPHSTKQWEDCVGWAMEIGQNFHVRHRLAQYGAGRCLDYEQTTPEVLASAIAEEISRPVSYRPVETDGAVRAAACLAELI
jgi:pimeloyl-ACP methyl ester carboxylesterase